LNEPRRKRRRWQPINTETCPRLRIQHVCRANPDEPPVSYKALCARAAELAKNEQDTLERMFDRAGEREVRYALKLRPVSVDMDDLHYRRVSEPADLGALVERDRQPRVTGMAAWDDDDRADRAKKDDAVRRARNRLPVPDSVAAFLRDAGKARRPLTRGKEIDLAKRIKAGGHDGRRARDEMISANLLLVVEIAKKYHGKGISQLDLIQEGSIGLMKAVDRFDYSRGNRFSTFAWNHIRGCITRAFKDVAQSHFRPAEEIQRQPLSNPTQAPTLSPEEQLAAETIRGIARDMEELGAIVDFDTADFGAGFSQRIRPTERA
jgi:RNA polymerase sigma factor (sigma-70 family)